MSYDLKLYRKDKSKKPFKEAELRAMLGGSFKYVVTDTKGDLAIGFTVGDETEKDSTEFHHQGKEGYYWTYCSYGVGGNDFDDFMNAVKKVAIKLDMLIQDPQVTADLVDPNSPDVFKRQSTDVFNVGKKSIQDFVDRSAWLLPTKSKHFILYFIMSTDPKTDKNVFLTLGGDKLYASKVNLGESIDQVVKREIPELTGNNKYKILEVQDYDSARDKHGNELPRYAIYIEVPFFKPNTVVLKQKVEWEYL